MSEIAGKCEYSIQGLRSLIFAWNAKLEVRLSADQETTTHLLYRVVDVIEVSGEIGLGTTCRLHPFLAPQFRVTCENTIKGSSYFQGNRPPAFFAAGLVAGSVMVLLLGPFMVVGWWDLIVGTIRGKLGELGGISDFCYLEDRLGH